jgi:hypothetical protein
VKTPRLAAAWIALNSALWGCQSPSGPGAEIVVGLDDAVAVTALERAESGVAEPDGAACDVASMRADLLARYDVDRDGQLEAAERAALRREFGGRQKRQKEQQLARLEHVKLLRWIYDANADRKLDAAEWQTLRDDIDARCQNSAIYADGQDARQRADELLRFDANHDGRLSPREWAAAWDARRLGIAMHWRTLISRFDNDGNGMLDARERAALREYERSIVRGERVATLSALPPRDASTPDAAQ